MRHALAIAIIALAMLAQPAQAHEPEMPVTIQACENLTQVTQQDVVVFYDMVTAQCVVTIWFEDGSAKTLFTLDLDQADVAYLYYLYRNLMEPDNGHTRPPAQTEPPAPGPNPHALQNV